MKQSKKGRCQVTVNPLETNGLPASLYFTSKFADEVGSEFIADFENPVNAKLVCKRLNDYAALQARCDRYEKALRDIAKTALVVGQPSFMWQANEALNGEGEKRK